MGSGWFGALGSDLDGKQVTKQVSEYVVELRNITKRFPGVVALSDMKLALRPGEIHGLIGENGAGKSTLIKVLTGVHAPDEGDIFIGGAKRVFKNPNDSVSAGIACVYQELNIEKLLSVTDNIFINKWIHKGLLLDYHAMHAKAGEVMSSLGQDVDPRKAAGTLGMGVQQMIEIAKAVLIDAKVIIMDEPTSSLGEKEVEQLMKTCRKLKSRGIAILFVSHKLEELFELCDCVTVMRDGKYIDSRPIGEWTNDSLITAMVGRTLENQFPKKFGVKGPCMLKVEHLSIGGVLRDVSFEAFGGQILGMSGLVGAGRTETVRAIFGADPVDEGAFYIQGKKQKITSPKKAIELGIALLTEDRKNQGLVLAQTIRTNLILSSMKKHSRGFFLHEATIEKNGQDKINTLRIKTPSIDEVVQQLSGGNQQKVVFSRALASGADILLLNHPTRGVDVGAKEEIYALIRDMTDEGKAVIVLGDTTDECIGLCSRLLVMKDGLVTGEFDAPADHKPSQVDVVSLMM